MPYKSVCAGKRSVSGGIAVKTEKYAVALGMFDGVHIGHKAVLNGAVSDTLKSVAVTFSSIPFKSGGSLMTADEKKEKLLLCGVDEVCFMDFFAVKDLSPEEFLNELNVRYPLGKICCGYNYRFGKNAVGDTAFLKEWCAKRNIAFFECPEVKYEGHTVSSTYIRHLISEGDVVTAAKLLEEPFSFSAEIVNGDKRGRVLGFPTANQIYPTTAVIPKNGVYRTLVSVDGINYNGVTNIGVRPTYLTDYISAETYIIGYSGDCYGKSVKIQLMEYIRTERKFSSEKELVTAIRHDVDYVKNKSGL